MQYLFKVVLNFFVMIIEGHKNKKEAFIKFQDYFLKYLKESSSFEEAFRKAKNRYRKFFKKIPYKDCQSFLSEFYNSQYNNESN